MKRTFITSLFLVVLILTPVFVHTQWIEKPQKITKTVNMDDSATVFVMPGDNIYHKDNCSLLTGGRTGMPFRSAKARGFKPCPECLMEKSIIIPGYDWSFSFQQPIQSKNLSYSDNYINISFIIEKTQIGFSIQNKTASGIKINWDELSFVSPTGRASRIIHSGIRLIDRNNAQASTTIPPNSRITDIAIPSENIQYINDAWREGQLFEGNEMFYNGKEFSLFFPIEIKGAKKEYSFKFRINVAQLMPEDKK